MPSEAVIRTGARNVVIVALGDGKFRAVPVEVGTEAGGQSEIRKGLKPGDSVVLSGAVPHRLGGEPHGLDRPARRNRCCGPGGNAQGAWHGLLKSIRNKAGSSSITKPIPAMQWPKMTHGLPCSGQAAARASQARRRGRVRAAQHARTTKATM